MAQSGGSAWWSIVNKAFPQNQRISSGRPEIIIKSDTGAPAAALGVKVGLLCWNSLDKDAYVCTVKSTTWLKINA